MLIEIIMRALSDPIRRKILELLKEKRMSAGEIVENFDVTGASISRHLSIFKNPPLNDYRHLKWGIA